MGSLSRMAKNVKVALKGINAIINIWKHVHILINLTPKERQ